MKPPANPARRRRVRRHDPMKPVMQLPPVSVTLSTITRRRLRALGLAATAGNPPLREWGR